MKNDFALQEMSFQELSEVYGGEDRSLLGDLAHAAGYTLRCIWEFSKQAAEYQSSLPANLKK